jgi:DNA-directed RNA polymerase specialized sigma24 family protein
LYLAHEVELFRYVARRVGSRRAETVLAEIFAVAWQQFGQLDGDVAPGVWLLAIAIEELRRCGPAELDHLRRFAATGVDPSTGVRSSDPLAAAVAGALAELSTADRDALTLHLWARIPHESIATIVGLDRRAVVAQVDRADRFVRQRVERARVELDEGLV